MMSRLLRKPAVRIGLSLSVLALALVPMAGCRGGVKALIAKFHHRKSKSKPNTTDYADNVAQVVSSPRLALLKWSDYSDYQPQVQQFYEDRNYELAWVRDGKPTDTTTALIALFADAAKKGLKPEDYDSSRWPQRLQRIETIRTTHDTSDNAQDVVAQFDAAMTISTMRYVSDLHVGRVNPQSLNFDIDVPAKRAAFDLTTFLSDQLVDADDVPATLATVEPQNPMYAATEKALGQYVMLAQEQGGTPPPPQLLPAVVKPVAVGGSYAALQPLLERLQLEGDSSTTDVPQVYDTGLAASVKHYQERHGLTADGKLTQATIDSMNVPMSVRVQQLSDSLERWRWLPDNFINPRVLVNLPEFIVRTYEADHSLAFKMKVVDGEAEGNHDTPMFVRSMRYVVFRPYWNLPPSIVKKEIMGHLNKSGVGYLAEHGYEAYKSDGTVVTSFTADDIAHQRYSVRQKPGPKNSLGLVKFLFPNEYDVYMHSTPELNLFNLTRRDRSHGCVRLEHADQMAVWVLQGENGDWDADKVSQAMNGTNDNKTVGLKTTLPVVLTYLTANADEDGTVHFFNDIYGYDKELETALAKGMPYSQAAVKINPKLTPGETE
jgi:murein L,D-transpeptidase YcbB/YkuD